LPWSEAKLRKIPPFEFENWAVIALGGIPNKTQVGDMGIDGRIFPATATPEKLGKRCHNHLGFGRHSFAQLWRRIEALRRDAILGTTARRGFRLFSNNRSVGGCPAAC